MAVFRSLSSRYHFVSILCSVQIVCGVLTMRSFGFQETGESQLMLIFYAFFNIILLHRLTRSTRRADHQLSRVDKHIHMLSVLSLSGFLILFIAIIFLFTRGHEVITPCFDLSRLYHARTQCKCAPLLIDLTLPVLIVGILFCAIPQIALRARTQHGEAMVQVPIPPPPPPPVQLVPAWALGNVCDTETVPEAQLLVMLEEGFRDSGADRTVDYVARV
ncbi:hypothetical protein R3P38DRAFT_2914484 [Favolaschia claudopus]|uniref:Uncharacterized protein n=1 Tax=Favolaschia claudopus TaxID=2862362 RepID=A0AAW0C4C4_9AGAR